MFPMFLGDLALTFVTATLVMAWRTRNVRFSLVSGFSITMSLSPLVADAFTRF